MRHRGPWTGVAATMLTLLLAAGCSSTKTHLRNLTQGDVDLQLSSIRELGESGSRAAKAFPVLVKMYNESENKEVRRAIIRVLGKVGKGNRNAAADILTNALFDADTVVRRNAVVGLADILPFPTGAFGALIQVLGDSDDVVRDLAMSTLIDYSSYCTHTLNRALKDRSPLVRSMAAQTLGCIGAGAKASLPSLKFALEDEDQRVRMSADEAIKRITLQMDGDSAER